MGETPEIVERVAKSMYDGFQRAVGHNFGPKWRPIPFEDADAQCQRYYRTAAREGIQAMREPTDAQRLAAYEAVEIDDLWDIADDERWAKSWRAGIDAALAAPEEGSES